jgi:hypothetical protein
MKIKHCNIELRMSELFTRHLCVPAWEVEVLRAVHGEGVNALPGEVLVDRRVPDAADEFRRLLNRYGSARDEGGAVGQPFVALVFGQFGVGTARLAKAIADATVADETADDLIGSEQASSVGG